jgi:hypothetical protein
MSPPAIRELFPSLCRALGEGALLGLLATLVSLGMAGLLLWAGAEKLRDLDPITKVVIHLGLPRRAALPAALALALTEVGVAVGLVGCPGSYLVVGGVTGLATLFAVAGWLALRSGERIRCNCLGSTGAGYLGRAQIVALPAWMGGSVLLLAAALVTRPMKETTLLVAVLTTVLALLRAPRALRALLMARGDRLATTTETAR